VTITLILVFAILVVIVIAHREHGKSLLAIVAIVAIVGQSSTALPPPFNRSTTPTPTNTPTTVKCRRTTQLLLLFLLSFSTQPKAFNEVALPQAQRVQTPAASGGEEAL
jgi:hypothetical protein